ncbi:hypothetical protein LEMLEM_LOCUS88 [Lemmus lemmus]
MSIPPPFTDTQDHAYREVLPPSHYSMTSHTPHELCEPSRAEPSAGPGPDISHLSGSSRTPLAHSGTYQHGLRLT